MVRAEEHPSYSGSPVCLARGRAMRPLHGHTAARSCLHTRYGRVVEKE